MTIIYNETVLCTKRPTDADREFVALVVHLGREFRGAANGSRR